MKYRKFGRLDWNVSVLGFGAMRLPLLDKDPAHIDETESIRMIRYGIDHGINYLDTAYPYHKGCSEALLGRALRDGYREKVRIATKLPCFIVNSAADFDRYLDEQLGRLQVNAIDFYLLHGLSGSTWTKMRDLNVLMWAQRALKDGRIGHLGFSFHDELKVFKEIVDACDYWTFCQIQYNYMDTEYQAGTAGLEYAAGKGLGVVIMEPLRGGKLAQKPPVDIAQLWNSFPEKRSPVDWALRWVWDHPEVSVALSGMSTMQQVVENVTLADHAGAGVMTGDELDLIEEVRTAYRKRKTILCSGCSYCMPCPNGVNIPRVFEHYNDGQIYENMDDARFLYNNYFGNGKRADECTECGQCVEICPQNLEIPDLLKKVHNLMAAPDTGKP